MSDKKRIHTQEYYNIRKEAEEFPMMIVLSFVYGCNAKCPNCPYTNSNIRNSYKDAMVIPEEIFKKIADESGQYNCLLRLSGGGEPMLHPKAVELILYAKAKGCKIGLITNGSMFDSDNLLLLIEAGIDAIEFSVDAGNKAEYAFTRPGLNWEVLNNNVNLAVEIRNKLNSDTRIIASAINQEGVNIDRIENYWSEIVDNVQIRKYLTWGINEDHSADSTSYLPPEERIPCPWLFERLNIDSRGDVTLCGEDIAFNEKFANICKNSIKNIWKGPEFTLYREKHLKGRGDDIPICSKCPDWQYRSWNHNYWKVLRNAENSEKYRKNIL
jgi:MoaA/NifB/PqqE/SkfB family radical SAM enzyme